LAWWWWTQRITQTTAQFLRDAGEQVFQISVIVARAGTLHSRHGGLRRLCTAVPQLAETG
jgi:hypothetical protein